MALITHSATMQGFTMRDYLRRVPEGFMQLLTWKHEGKLVYREHIVEGLEQFPDAFEMLFRGENNGKLLIQGLTMLNQIPQQIWIGLPAIIIAFALVSFAPV